MASSSASGRQSNGLHDQIGEFCSLTSCTPEQAEFYLEASNAQLDRAIEMFYDQENRDDTDPGVNPVDEHGGSVTEDRSPLQQGGPRSRQRRGFGWLNPVRLLQTGVQKVFQTAHAAASLLGVIGSSLLPQSLLRSLRGRLGRLLEAQERSPEEAAAKFMRHFAAQYGASTPHWQTRSWADSSRLAHSQFKFLFIYLHAPNHQDTEKFCREAICNADLVDYVNSTFVCWAGDITTPDAFKLSQSLRVTSYPYTALLAFSGQRIRLITGTEGYFTPGHLLSLYQQAQETHAVNLVAEQAEQAEQNMSRRLREEQDEEYQRSLEADRERERQRDETSQKEAAARRAAEETAAKERAAREEEERQAAERISTLRHRRQTKADKLGAEPAPGSPGSTHIRFRLPDGRNFQRRFLASDTLQKAYDFMDSLDSLDVLKYILASSYPRRVFSDEVMTQSFQDLGLIPQATLFVQSQED